MRVLTRDAALARRRLPAWDYGTLEMFEPAAWHAGVCGADAVVNLAGEPISARWTEAVRTEILESRVQATTRVVDALNAAVGSERPSVLVSASAVGFYGASTSARFDEQSESGRDYLSLVCRRWEAAAAGVPSGVRCVVLRFGIVLGLGGGALAKMAPVFQSFIGGPIGDGRQWMSWIHRDDLVSLILQSLTDDGMSGAYNATSPQPVRMNELVQCLGAVMGRPSWLPVPEFAIQALLGEGSKAVLEGQFVVPTRTLTTGFTFRYANVSDALRAIIRGSTG